MSNPEIGLARASAFEFVYPELPTTACNDLLCPIERMIPDSLSDFCNSSDDDKQEVLKTSLNPYQVEHLLAETGSHLEICLKYHFQGLDISDQLERTLLEIKFTKDQIEKNVVHHALLESHLDQRSKVVFAQTKIDKVDGNYVGHSSSIPMVKEITRSDDERAKNALQNEKLKLESLVEKMNTAGNALNYKERRVQIKGLFDIEFTEFYKKLYAASIGLKRVFSIELDVPQLPTDNALFKCRSAYAKAMSLLESKIKYDHDLTLQISLKNGLFRKDTEAISLITNPTFSFNKVMEINVTPELFEGLKNVRLRGFRLYAYNEGHAVKYTGEVIHVGVDMPSQKFVENMPVRIPRVTCQMPYINNPGAILAPHFSGVNNFNPIGKWALTIPERSSFGLTTAIKDIIIELVVSATYDMGD